MGEMKDNALLSRIEFFKLLVGTLQSLIHACIFNGKRHHVGHGAQQLDILLIECTLPFVYGAKDADHTVLNSQWHIQQVPGMVLGLLVDLFIGKWAFGVVGHNQGPPRSIDFSSHTLVCGETNGGQFASHGGVFV